MDEHEHEHQHEYDHEHQREHESRHGAPEPGTGVGLGRVVENAAGLGDMEPETGDGPLVEEASEDSFPASDPPEFMSGPATPSGRPSA